MPIQKQGAKKKIEHKVSPYFKEINSFAKEKKFSHYIKPMLAKAVEKPFDDDDWIFEIKWDGYRALAEINNHDVKLYSRNWLSFENKYPIVFDALKKIKKNVVIDGEIVALDEAGKSSFQLLQQYEQVNCALVYYVFDCLSLNGTSIEKKPLIERKKTLKSILPNNDIIKYCDHIEGEGTKFFGLVRKQHLEGIIAKRKESRYYEGKRSQDWLKIKHVQTQEAVIVGYTNPRGSRKHFGALILGAFNHGKLEYIGNTGTGFNNLVLKELHTKLQPIITVKSPFKNDIKVNEAVTWVKPILVCNVKFTEITSEGMRRHPVFMGLREDKAAKEVKKEFPVEAG